MKRNRVDEVQFRARPAHPILNTQHGPTIQYQIAGASPIKGNVSDSPTSIGASTPTVQYTTYYPYTQSPVAPGGNVKTSQPPAGGGTAIHVVNAGAVNVTNSVRHKTTLTGNTTSPITPTVGTTPTSTPSNIPGGQSAAGQEKFQRLKVEDALSYLDQVKYKFGNQPQVYNDFLDIMKEFKSQSIDTPGVIQRVSNLFKGHPELIVGFNTFLPPGYKIEVQANDQGVAFQVSVSVPSPSGGNIHLTQPTSPNKGSSQFSMHQIQPVLVPPSAPQHIHIPIQQAQQSPIAAVPQNFSRDRSASQCGSQQPPPSAAAVNDLVNSQGHALHHISQAHQTIMQAEQTGNQNQPVEFNHAISYVNKIKIRFQTQPEKYKRFLEILHAYQKEQKIIKESSGNLQPSKQLTEAEVYSQVAKLFDQQEDLLREFGQFLPDATSHSATQFISKGHAHSDHKKVSGASMAHQPSNIKPYNNAQNSMSNRLDRIEFHNEKEFHRDSKDNRNHVSNQKFGHNSQVVKRSASNNSMNLNNFGRERDGPMPPKRHKPINRDVTLAEASKYGSLNDYAFFDKVRKALRNPEVYENFLRCLTLYNQEIVSKSELIGLIAPFLGKFPELYRWFQEFLGSASGVENVPLQATQRQDRTTGDLAQEIDLNTCKRLGASYCALPKQSESRKCSGRNALGKEVLNDTWVSFPTWAEDSTFVTSRKTQYEEIIYRCEDERFELDVVIETNSATIRVLENVQKRLSRMSSEEVTRFRLDDNLGGSSATIHQRAIKRIYGDKASEVIQGLKKNPLAAVGVVLKRLKAKEEEWREAQKGFNKQWREQNEKYYLKSLDHQGINFKQNDIKALRSKSLFNEIETLYDERHEQNDETPSEPNSGPHLTLPYKDKTILEDAANLLIHHVKRQTGIQKQEKTKIKHILRQFVPDLFFSPRQQLSDDERDDDDKDMDVDNSDTETKIKSENPSTSSTTLNRPDDYKEKPSNQSTILTDASSKSSNTSDSVPVGSASDRIKPPESIHTASTSSLSTSTPFSLMSTSANNPSSNDAQSCNVNKVSVSTSGVLTSETVSNASVVNTIGDSSLNDVNIKQEIIDRDSPSPNLPSYAVSKHSEEAYTLFLANNNWYLFLRLHAILCDRLRTMYDRANALAAEEAKYRSNRRDSTATSLRLKPKSDIQVEDYYPTFLDMLKNVLDGNIDINSYEDSLREMFGIHAYVAFTLDRVVTNSVRQLQHCVTERGAIECVELFHQEQRRNSAGGYCKTAHKRVAAELAYQRRAESILQDENCFKVYIYKIDCKVTIELLDTESDETEKCVSNAQTWNNYVECLTNPMASMSNATRTSDNSNLAKIEIKTEKSDDDADQEPTHRPLFLHRNIRRFKSQQSTKSISLLDSEQSYVLGEDTRLKVATESTSKTIVNTTTSSSTTTTTATDSETSGSEGAAQNRIINDPFWGKRPPERIGTGANDGFFVEDKSEVKLNLSTYKMVFVMNKDVLFYKKNSLRKAKQMHSTVTSAMAKKFHSFVSSWKDKNVTDSQESQCSEWFMGRHVDLVSNVTTLHQNNDVSKTPYRTYNRYKVERLNEC
ncbi:hypothetical protein HA402_009667 [Bradysia odoriphaga]|nr:hypothetical protein HA402_009667 [Bradysia odoriphaga]